MKAIRFAAQLALYLPLMLILGYFSTEPRFSAVAPGEALVRISFIHATERREKCRSRSEAELAKLAPNMRAALDCPRERTPLEVQLELDGRLVPNQPVAHDAGGVDEDEERNAGEPAEEPRPTEVLRTDFFVKMPKDKEYKRIRRVAMHAAQDATEPPFELRDGRVGARRARVEPRVQVQAARGEEPEEEPRRGSEVARQGRNANPPRAALKSMRSALPAARSTVSSRT